MNNSWWPFCLVMFSRRIMGVGASLRVDVGRPYAQSEAGGEGMGWMQLNSTWRGSELAAWRATQHPSLALPIHPA